MPFHDGFLLKRGELLGRTFSRSWIAIEVASPPPSGKYALRSCGMVVGVLHFDVASPPSSGSPRRDYALRSCSFFRRMPSFVSSFGMVVGVLHVIARVAPDWLLAYARDPGLGEVAPLFLVLAMFGNGFCT